MSLTEAIRNWLLEPVLKEMKKMATQQELEAGLQMAHDEMANLKAMMVDLGNDQQAAFAKLQADIVAGNVDLGPSMAALGSLIGKMTSLKADVAALDSAAEGISGLPTP